MGGARNTTLEGFDVFCAKAFAGIGTCLPDTILDRAITIRLQRKTRDEVVERFRRRIVAPEGAMLHDRLADWVEPQLDWLHAAHPDLPGELDDRAQDIWEPLLAIADAAGGEWPQRARRAALTLSSGDEREDDSLTARLLADVHTAFEEAGEDRLRTSDLIERLAAIEEGPWGDWHGKTISPQALSKLLRPYRIKTMPVRTAEGVVKGYKVEQFADAFSRVLGVTRVTGVTRESRSQTDVTAVTLVTPTTRGNRPMLGEEMYDVMLAEAVRAGHLTHSEASERLALHRRIEELAAA